MRRIALAVATACLLAACGQNAQQQDAGGADGGGIFPDLTRASYRAEATITDDNGQTMPVVMIRDGVKMRMEFSASEGATTIITNSLTNESIVITNAGGRTMAMRTDTPGMSDPADQWGGEMASSATRTGSCNIAGESGHEWTRTEDESPNTACVTSDGIILRATENGRTAWETTRVDRGPQAASLFEVPPGVQVMDLGDMGAAMNQMMERAKGAGGN